MRGSFIRWSTLPGQINRACIPALTLKGQWLEAAGFATGTEVDVKVMNGCIVLTAQQPQPEESELMQSLRQVCKLSARKQKQVQAFISVMADKTRKLL